MKLVTTRSLGWILFLVSIAFSAASVNAQYDSPVPGPCRWAKIVVGQDQYRICYFVITIDGQKKEKEIYYVPPMLIMEKPTGPGAFFDIRRFRDGHQARNIVTFFFVRGDSHFEREILKEVAQGNWVPVRQVLPQEIRARMKIPGTEHWISSRHTNDSHLTTYGDVVLVSFELDEEQTRRIREEVNRSGIEFQIDYRWIGVDNLGTEVWRRISHEFSSDFLDRLFETQEEVLLTPWQLKLVKSMARKVAEVSITVRDEDYLEEDMRVIEKWLLDLPRYPVAHPLEVKPSPIKDDIGKESNLYQQHEAMHKFFKNPGEVSEEERMLLRGAEWTRVRKSDLNNSDLDNVSISRTKLALSEVHMERNTVDDLFAARRVFENLDANYQKRPISRNIVALPLGSIIHNEPLGLMIDHTNPQAIGLQSRLGTKKRIPVLTGENVKGYEIAPEDSGLRIHFQSEAAKIKSVLCLERDTGELQYHRMSVGPLDQTIVLRPYSIRSQSRREPERRTWLVRSLGDVPIVRGFWQKRGSVEGIGILFENGKTAFLTLSGEIL